MSAIYTRPPRPAPRDTLGEQVELWMSEWLVDGVTGDPLILTDEQSYFLDLWYALDDNGRWLYDRGALRRARGTGKSPFAAYMAAAELCGPVRFGGWDEDGNPIGREARQPFIQIIATTLEQANSIMEFALNCWSPEAIEKYGLRIGVVEVKRTLGNKGRIRRLANNPRALRGGRPTHVWIEESSEWVQANGGHAALDRIRGNIAKSPDGGRMCELANAYTPGEESLAEKTHAAWLKQTGRTGARVSILYDSLEADPDTTLHDPVSLRKGLREAAGDAIWLDIETLAALALDPDVPPSQFRREHLNMIVVSEDNVISAQSYGKLVDSDLRPLIKGDIVTVGCDPSLSDDDTAVVAFRLSDRSFHLIHHQTDPKQSAVNRDDEAYLSVKWRVDEGLLDDAVAKVRADCDVRGFATDVYPLDDLVAEWEAEFGEEMELKARPGSSIKYDMRNNRRELTYAFEALLTQMEQGKVRMPADGTVRQHWLNAKLRPNPNGNLFGKATRHSRAKVDIVAACLLAHLMGMKLLAQGEVQPSVMVAHHWT